MLSKNSPKINNSTYISNMKPAKINKLKKGLYVTATPIGNLKDITLRGLETLENVDMIACEDTRRSRKLLNYYSIRNKLLSFHDANEHRMQPKIIESLNEGKSIALISDAGTPLINDPGYKLVLECIKLKIPVITIPGASSLTSALSISGIPTNKFSFFGFFPSKSGEKEKLINTSNFSNSTIVFFETPKRLKSTINLLSNKFPDRNVSICKELTKLHEKIIFGKLRDISLDTDILEPKGEYIIILAPQTYKQVDVSEAILMLKDALKLMRISEAVSEVSLISGISKKDLYRKAIEIKKND